MTNRIHVTYVPESFLRKTAAEFRAQHAACSAVPVDIERIVEFDLGMDIIPIAGLKDVCRADAFISSDLRSVSVDEDLFLPRNESRYRFSLAHEVAHLLLHADILSTLAITCIDEYVTFVADLDPLEYDQMEWQANALAGLILVPPEPLAERFAALKRWAQEKGIRLEECADSAAYVVANRLKDDFHVSRQTVEIRLERDKLLNARGSGKPRSGQPGRRSPRSSQR